MTSRPLLAVFSLTRNAVLNLRSEDKLNRKRDGEHIIREFTPCHNTEPSPWTALRDRVRWLGYYSPQPQLDQSPHSMAMVNGLLLVEHLRHFTSTSSYTDGGSYYLRGQPPHMTLGEEESGSN